MCSWYLVFLDQKEDLVSELSRLVLNYYAIFSTMCPPSCICTGGISRGQNVLIMVQHYLLVEQVIFRWHLLSLEASFVPTLRYFESFIAPLFVTKFSKNTSNPTPVLWQNLAFLRNFKVLG